MKKLSKLLLIVMMALSLSACGVPQPRGGPSPEPSSVSEEDTRGSGETLDGGEESESAQPEALPEDSFQESSDRDDREEVSPEIDDTDEANQGSDLQREPASDGASEDSAEEDILAEDGSYTSRDEVALYIYQYGRLPSNFITKKEAEKLGWEGGSLEPYAPGKCIGGSRFGNYEGLLPEAEGRVYTECDIDTLGASKRGAKRIVFSNDGLIYYTEDHYESFELLYGEE